MATKRNASTVGNTGGPGTATGVVYQNAVAALLLLQEVERYLNNPASSAAVVRLEPRHVSDAEPTAWDAHVETRNTSSEMKARPTRQDVLEFVKAAGIRTRSPDARVVLICGYSNGPTLTHLEMLLKRAGEATDDDELRARLEHDHRLADVEPILAEFGTMDVATRLRRVDVEVRLEDDAVTLAQELAAALVGRERAPDLVRFLRDRTLRAATGRESISVPDLVSELIAASFRFTERARRIFAGVPESVRPLEGIMSRLQFSLPLDVVSTALGIAKEAISADLAPLVDAQCVLIDDGFIGLAARARSLDTANRDWSPALGSSILRNLVRWLGSCPPGRMNEQAQNVVTIADILVADDPSLVARTYYDVEKSSKTWVTSGSS